MRILAVTPRVPYPLDKGDRLRAFHQLKALSRRHEVALFALSNGPASPEAMENLTFCSRVEFCSLSRSTAVPRALSALVFGLPAQIGYFKGSGAVRRLRRFAEEFTPQVGYFQLARAGPYQAAVSCPTVLDYMDCFSEGLRQRRNLSRSQLGGMALGVEQRRMRRYEHALSNRFTAFSAISTRDIENLDLEVPVSLVPNGVDLEEFSPVSSATDGAVEETDLLFVGNLEYPPNVLAIRELIERTLPRLRRDRPGTTLRVAGKNPPRWLRRMRGDGLDVCGWSEEAAPWYRAAKVFVAPMPVATGVQNKLLQALASGVPCVATPVAAKPFVAANAPVVAAEAEHFAQEVLHLLDHDDERTALGRRSREFAEARLSWEQSTSELEKLLVETSSKESL